MVTVSPYRSILARAAALSGGRRAFAKAASVDEGDLQSYLCGICTIPEEVVEKALDVVLRDDAAPTRKLAPK